MACYPVNIRARGLGKNMGMKSRGRGKG
uniref:DNA packaging protein protamine 2 n=1 Tax=Cricetulus griseus TaxID=10029 RepID=Q9EP54_CRIGR|nr:DNA packaging protein protamine 2 [Cricetulus griseus]AAG09807.1 DNA packaging protein protamine 2 [Cricetulus griseus]